MRLNIELFGGRGASSSNNINSKINNIYESGKVITFGTGPTNTYISLDYNGFGSINKWDAPIKMATKDGILNEIQDEALAIVDKDQVNLRSNYFKRNGFEIVGTKERNNYETYILIKRQK